MAAIVFPTDPDRLDYVSAPWSDPLGKQWTYEVAKDRWNPYLSSSAPGGGSGTVTSVSGTGTVSGLTLTGTVTSSGSLTLGGTLAVTASNFASQTANYILAAPNGSAGVPTFRAIVAADIPTLNQNTTGNAATATLAAGVFDIGNLSGDITSANRVTTLATVNSNVGSFGSTTAIPTFTVNAKGLVTAAGTVAVVAPAGTLTGATLAAGVTASSLTSVGTITTGTWNGSVIAPAYLGTGTSITTKYLRGDGTWQTISGGGDALTSGNLSQFAATTSAQLAGVISDETGSGALVFATSPTLVTPALGTPSSATLTNATGLPSTGVSDSVATWTSSGSHDGKLIKFGSDGNVQFGSALSCLDSVSGFKFTISHDTTMSANRTYNPPNASGYLALTANASGIPDTLASGTVIPWEIQLAASDETTALTTGTAKMTFRMPWAATLTSVRSSVTTAPTGSTLIVDINEGGTTILSTKLSIDASEKTSTSAATAAVISDSALADDAEITIDIDQVGSTVAGAGLKITLRGTRTI